MKSVQISFVTFILLAACSSIKEETAKVAPTPTTFVLVHGALGTKEVWAKTEQALRDRGQNVVSFDVPGRNGDGLKAKDVDLEIATSKVCEVALAQDGPVTLVGHSQGGALIIQALNYCPDKIKALVFLTAVVPLSGETPFQGLDPKLDTGFGKITSFDKKASIFRLNKKGPVRENFMGDVPEAEAKVAIAGMVNEPAGIGTNPVTVPNATIFSKPSFYIVATEDKIISPESQRRFLARLPNVKTFEIPTSHSPYLSQPDKVAEILAQINAGPV